MRWLYKLPLRLRSLFRGGRVDDELTEELRFHLQAQIETNLAKGMTPEESRYAALRELGGLEQIREECRDMRRVNYIDNFVQDLRYALRTLRKSPAFATVAVLTLAVGIGANIAIFSLANAVLLRPLPYWQPDRLVHIDWQWEDFTAPWVTGEEYAFWREHSRVFESAAAHGLLESFNLRAGLEPQYVKGWTVSRDFFSTLGVQPFIGRGFTAEEDRPSGPRVAILSYDLWNSRFAADRAILGRAITLNDESYTVVGVMPRGFQFLLEHASAGDVDVWLPLRLVPDPADNGHNCVMIARLKPGINLEEAQRDMSRVLAEIRRDVPGHVGARERGVLLTPLQKWVTGDIRQPVFILLAAVGLVLLIATVNLANLLIARVASQRTDMAVRVALGAGAGRVLLQVLAESVLVAFAGGVAALIAAPWVLRLLIAISPPGLPLLDRTRIDLRVLGFSLLVTIAAGIAAAIAPALRIRTLNVGESLKAGGRRLSSGSGRERLRRWLVGFEVALSTLLVSGALLLAVSLINLERVNPGFNPQHLWSFHLSLTPARLNSASGTWNFEQQVLAKLQELPGVPVGQRCFQPAV
jgi:predicted permease